MFDSKMSGIYGTEFSLPTGEEFFFLMGFLEFAGNYNFHRLELGCPGVTGSNLGHLWVNRPDQGHCT
jgi:hypothetical protein